MIPGERFDASIPLTLALSLRRGKQHGGLRQIGSRELWSIAADHAPSPQYVFSVGSTGDSPVPSGDAPDGMAGSVRNDLALHFDRKPPPIPLGESPSGAVGSPALPTLNTYSPQGLG